jgi:hypothetical protein
VLKRAHVRDISPEACTYQHPLDVAVVAWMKAEYERVGCWTFPPMLVVERDNQYLLLDGHHRVAAARQLGLESIPAFVLSAPDYAALLNEHFGGLSPTHLARLYGYVVVDDEGWTYPFTQRPPV